MNNKILGDSFAVCNSGIIFFSISFNKEGKWKLQEKLLNTNTRNIKIPLVINSFRKILFVSVILANMIVLHLNLL